MPINLYTKLLLAILRAFACIHVPCPLTNSNEIAARRGRATLVLSVIVVLCLFVQPALAQSTASGTPRAFVPVQEGPIADGQDVLPYAPRRLLVKLKAAAMARARVGGGPEIRIESFDALGRHFRVKRVRRAFGALRNIVRSRALGINRWHVVDLDQDTHIPEVVARYAANLNVEAATPDWRAFPAVQPNDPLHPDHWGHDNTGQLPDYCWFCGGHDNGSPVGIPGFDAASEAAWDQAQGYGDSAVVIAILDSGVDASHPDLRQVAGWDLG
ncbi:MAG: hypothetical protein KJP23_29245, partial [Deltaproteobacteria bacterium]|nr:hypothetical protein [Deltaproteobacteria bacterium]